MPCLGCVRDAAGPVRAGRACVRAGTHAPFAVVVHPAVAHTACAGLEQQRRWQPDRAARGAFRASRPSRGPPRRSLAFARGYRCRRARTTHWRARSFSRSLRRQHGSRSRWALRSRRLPALFRFKKLFDFDTIAFLFLFNKYYLITEELGLKHSSHDLQVNCAISYLFYLYLIFHISYM